TDVWRPGFSMISMTVRLQLFVFFRGYWPEPDPVSRPEKARDFFVRQKQIDRCPADQLPSPRRSDRINTCLRAGDADCPGRYLQPRRWPPWSGDALVHAAKERKPGGKADHFHVICITAVDPDDFFLVQPVMLGDKCKVRPEIPAVAYWNFHRTPFTFSCRPDSGKQLLQPLLHLRIRHSAIRFIANRDGD